MPKASEIALELRKMADSLDLQSDTELPRPFLDFYCKYIGEKGKPMFIALARIIPHPLTKGPQKYDSDAGFEVRYTSDALEITAKIERHKVCRIVEAAKTIPAVYDCEPILSELEEAALTES